APRAGPGAPVPAAAPRLGRRSWSSYFAHVLVGKPVPKFPGHATCFAHVLVGKPVPTFPGHALVRQLGHARQHETFDVGRAVDVTEVFERLEQRAHLGPRDLARVLEERVLVEEVVGTGAVILLE